MKINIKVLVTQLLEEYMDARSCDAVLMCAVYHQINPRINSITFTYFWKQISLGELPSPESISRARRKIQEECEHLQGANHGKRQAHGETIRYEINSNDEQALMQL